MWDFGGELCIHVKMGGIERGRRRLQIRRTEDVHLRSAAQVKYANNRMWAIPKQNTGAERIVDIAWLFHGGEFN